jgi:DNA (cytosine-5)-methyltransferase 1
MNPITFGSLFAGIGGIDLGFERCGMECKWQVEINDYAQKVLAKHWPKVHRERDIRECSTRNLERVDIIAGGFPCQDISYAGLGAGLDGERSGLFFEAIRLVRELQPRAVVLENVAALLTRGMDRVLGTLAEVGYDAEWHCIPAAYVGAPHIRDRVFVLGYANCGRRESGGAAWETARHRLSTGATSSHASSMADTRCELRKSRASKRPGSDSQAKRGSTANDDQRCGEDVADTASVYAQGSNNQSGQVQPWRSSWWAVEPDVGRVAHGVPARVDRLRGLGNAVVPQVAEYVGRMVLERLKRN